MYFPSPRNFISGRRLLFFSLLLVYLAPAETFRQRFERLAPRPENLFYAPQSEQDQDDYLTGQISAWKSYSRGPRPGAHPYSGYILFEDPFHYGQKRISFLLGTDCSTFVHRLFQLMGADYPFAKTRHWLALAAGTAPVDFSPCRWQKMQAKFQRVRAEEIEAGDVMIYGNANDDMGLRGHMAIVLSRTPFTVLHAKYKLGILVSEMDLADLTSAHPTVFFRYREDLPELPSYAVKDRLALNYARDNSGCE